MYDNNEGQPTGSGDTDEDRGPRAVFTISGIPTNGDPINLKSVISSLSELVDSGLPLKDVEIGMIKDAPDMTFANSVEPEEMQKMINEFGAEGVDMTLQMKALAASELIMVSTFELSSAKSDEEWNKHSEEEKEAFRQRWREQQAEDDARMLASLKKQREDEIRQVFDIANKWGAEPDLRPMERAHGVAHDIYALYGFEAKPTKVGNNENYVWPIMAQAYPISAGQAYAQHYDTNLSEQIRSNNLRLAKDLFD